MSDDGFDKIVDLVIRQIPDRDREEVLSLILSGHNTDRIAIALHHTLGRHIRNLLGLWTDNNFVERVVWDSMSDRRRAIYAKIGRPNARLHPDDISHELIVAAINRIAPNCNKNE